ncbi:MAG: hypothetical protein ACXADY_12900 [Candidatus Hodarchaeales archaeon]
MLKQLFEPILDDIAKWSLIMVIISFFLTVISILLTIDLFQGSNSAFHIFSLAMSNYLFYVGSIAIAIGLILVFFKPPKVERYQGSPKLKFKPKYKEKKSESSKTVNKKPKDSSNSLFSPREIKFLLSGLINIGVAILLWIAYLIISQ